VSSGGKGVPTVELSEGQTAEISYEISSEGVLNLPRRVLAPTLAWSVEAHRGPQPVAVAIARRGEAPLAGVERAPASDLLSRFARAEVVLEPVLLAVARAVAAGTPLLRAAQSPARVEPAPGILVVPLRTPTLPPATHTNCVLVGDRELTLVEPATPYDDEAARLLELLGELRAAGRRVVALLLTHHHLDHIGAAARLREALGAPVFAHAETARRVAATVRVDRELTDGDEVGGLRALYTPGHAPGHLCYLEPRTRTLIAGDMVAGEGTILVSTRDDGDMATYLASLRCLGALDLHALVPAHGPPTARPRALCQRYVAHRLMREQKVLGALAALGGSGRDADLLPRVYDDTPQAAWPLAAISLEAHLEKLTREGRTHRQGDRWVLG
jgi:glyoxylase-like metal-dependent hydrolase (beta-lactamase superfamily II)